MTTFIRALDDEDKSNVILEAVSGRRSAYHLSKSDFSRIPTSPFCYWVGDEVRSAFSRLPPLESEGRTTKQGLATADDFRFVRCWTEVGPAWLGSRWRPMVKGGKRSPWYRDLNAVVHWHLDGRELRNFFDTTTGKLKSRPQNVDWYLRPGISWPLRGIKFSAEVVPEGAVFSIAGKMAFAPAAQLLELLGVMNSSAFDRLLVLFAGKVGGVQYESGLIARVPTPPAGSFSLELGSLARAGWSGRRSLDTSSEVSHAFLMPAILQVDGDGFVARVLAWGNRVAAVEAELARVHSEIDELCIDLYGISEAEQRAIAEGLAVDDANGDGSDDDDDSDSEVDSDPVGLAAGLVSWTVGVAVGRFDLRLAIGDRAWPAEPDPFDPLPVCSPGVLTGDNGLPLLSPPDRYPLAPSAMLVDDPGHELDLAARVRSVFDVVFGNQADAWWSDVGAVLDSKSGIGGWLRRGFFDHHLKTYSKSRRKAPIMWPIGTRSGSYCVWLYAHQVTNDTLFRVLGDVVEPKLAAEQRRLSDLTQEFGSLPSASQRRGLAAQQSLVDELIELRDQLRAVAPLWSPDLNDGIVIVLSPLWRLFAHHRAWSKELKDRWGKLAKGEYDWAQLAMHIWPERVIPKCAADRSLAIAHDLEHTFWAQDATNADKWHPRRLPTTPIDQLIAERTNPTIDAARTHPNP